MTVIQKPREPRKSRKPRKPWGQLSERSKREKLRYYGNNFGLDREQVAKRYNRGTLGPQSQAKGRLKPDVVPDDVRRHPEKYRKLGPGSGGKEFLQGQVISHLDRLDLSDDIKFNRFNVLHNITQVMTEAELLLALSLDSEDWRDLASRKPARNRQVNPFWYH